MTHSPDKLDPSLISQLAPLLRMLGSGADGEIVGLVRILRQKLTRGGADFHALVDRLEKPQMPSTSAGDLHWEFERGRAAGRAGIAPMTLSSDKLAPLIPELAPLLRMLGSGADGEIVNSVRILRQKLERGGADFHALVARLEKPQTELHREFERGRAAGRAEMSTAAAGGGGHVGNGYGDAGGAAPDFRQPFRRDDCKTGPPDDGAKPDEPFTAFVKRDPRAGQALEIHKIHVTIFDDEFARRLRYGELTLPELANGVRETTAPSKGALPLLKLQRFGDMLTAKGCWRHNANVQECSGIEVEHDAGTITFDAAVATMRKAGIRCIVYTSPSYIPGTKERWRILIPLSKMHPPETRVGFVARVNGLFGGQLAAESFVLSQAFYFGRVDNNPNHRVELLDGEFLNLLDRTYAGSIFKDGSRIGDRAAAAGRTATPAAERVAHLSKASTAHNGPASCFDRIVADKDDLINKILTGAPLHTSLVSLSASAVAKGMTGEAVVSWLRDLMERSAARRDDEQRWQKRYNDIPRIVASAEAKYGWKDRSAGLGPLLRDVYEKIVAQAAKAAAEEEARTADGLEIWSQSRPLRNTCAERYLRSCGIIVPDEARQVLRFHPACPFDGRAVPALVALVTNIVTDNPLGIHCTALTEDGRKLGHKTLGATKGGAIKLSPISCIGSELAIGAGLEASLSARALGIDTPMWCLLGANEIGDFPVLPNLPMARLVSPQLGDIERLVIVADNDVDGVSQKAAARTRKRWEAARRKVRVLTPEEPGSDFNDLLLARGR